MESESPQCHQMEQNTPEDCSLHTAISTFTVICMQITSNHTYHWYSLAIQLIADCHAVCDVMQQHQQSSQHVTIRIVDSNNDYCIVVLVTIYSLFNLYTIIIIHCFTAKNEC